MENTFVPEKEIAKYNKELDSADKFSKGLVIKNDEDYQSAMEEGKLVKSQLDAITSRKEEITKPINTALKSLREMFKPLETRGETALATIKNKMLAYSREKQRKIDEDKAKLASRVERGTMKEETAVKKMEAMPVQEKTVQSETAKATTKKVKKYRLIDVYKIPKEFLKPTLKLSDIADTDKVKASFKLGQSVPGVEEYIEEELSIG